MTGSIYLFVSTLFAVICRSYSGEIKCYCNLPDCGPRKLCSTDDSTGACFSDFLDYKQISKARQGCLHILPKSKQDQCGNAPGSTGAPRSLLLCCQVNMCNQLTHSIIESIMNATEREVFFGVDDGGNGGRTYGGGYTNHEVWFKAATIAVPICGAMILLMLVAVACKFLRSDHVTVDKFCNGASNAAVEMKQYSVMLAQDPSKKVPLLYDTRHNCEEFRNATTTRIHYGQNVNVLREPPRRPDKNVNVEYARVCEAAVVNNDVSAATSDGLDVRVDISEDDVPNLTVNLEKQDQVNSCNLYTGQRHDRISADKYNKYVPAETI